MLINKFLQVCLPWFGAGGVSEINIFRKREGVKATFPF